MAKEMTEETTEVTKTLDELLIEMLAAMSVLGNLSADFGMKLEECNGRLTNCIASTEKLQSEQDLRGFYHKVGVVQGCCFGAVGAVQALNEMVSLTISPIVQSEQVKRSDKEEEDGDPNKEESK